MKTVNSRLPALLILCLFCSPASFARLGETQDQLLERFGAPKQQSKHSTLAQGKFIELGPVLYFKQGDWRVECSMIDGRCMKIAYSKPGDWSEDQVRLVLDTNAQGARWKETSKPEIAKLERTWTRADGSTAKWRKGSGMTLIWDAYNKAKAQVEERARVESARKPNI